MVFRIYNSSSCQQPIPMYSQFWELMMKSNEEFLYNIQFGFPVFDSNTGSFLWFCLSLHIQFGHKPWIVFLSLHVWKCWDIIFPERERAEIGGADQWVLKRRECSGFARVNKVTSASLGYPLSVFNKNSTHHGRGRRLVELTNGC